MSTSGAEQRRIVAWFDSVYSRKGDRYLRPVEAYIVFLELLRARPEHKLLDVACGSGMMLRAATEYASALHGIDISNVAAAQAKRKLPGAQIAVANAERLPYKDETFDLITCLGSLERMLDIERALRELRRVGRNDAKYCFLVRNANTFSWRYLAVFTARQRTCGHAGARHLEEWVSLFESQAFRIVHVLPDQYPLHRRRKWASLSLRDVDFRRPLTTHVPLARANEFVFLLEKRS